MPSQMPYYLHCFPIYFVSLEPISPTGLSAIDYKPKFIKVTWNPVKKIDQNGPGFGYRLRYFNILI